MQQRARWGNDHDAQSLDKDHRTKDRGPNGIVCLQRNRQLFMSTSWTRSHREVECNSARHVVTMLRWQGEEMEEGWGAAAAPPLLISSRLWTVVLLLLTHPLTLKSQAIWPAENAHVTCLPSQRRKRKCAQDAHHQQQQQWKKKKTTTTTTTTTKKH
ncbi:hypothetical protein ACLKA7_016952 [Drosophila subpalustris]